MSDQALAWKAGFGALVLVFCAATWWVRKPAERVPAAQPPAAASPRPALPDVPQPADPAPLDVQEDTPPVRIQVTLHDEEPAAKSRKPVAQVPRAAKRERPRIHNVSARRKASPYAVGRKHYPVGPGQRWALRDAP